MDENRPVLIVEDDKVDVLMIKRAFKDLNISNNLVFAGNGEEALDYLSDTKKDKPCLILLDINMQGMNGYEIATRIKSFNKYKNKPLIAVTADTLKKSRDLALISGCDGFIKKPIDISNIINQIEEFLNGKKEKVKQSKFYELLREYNLQLVSHLEREILELQRANKDLIGEIGNAGK